MGKKLGSIWQVLAVIAALAVVMAVAPAIGQEEISTDGETLHLHIGTDGKYFRHVAADGTAIATQNLPEPVGCVLRNVDGPLAALTANNGGVGIFGTDIGVKSTGAQGIPCSRVDGDDRLTLTLGEGLIAKSGELDLELKGNARVVIELFLHGTRVGETFRVISGTDVTNLPSVTLTPDNTDGSCRGASDSGPDSGSSDNCRVILQPEVAFNAIELSVEQGETSLAGGGDFSPHVHDLHDTIFHLIKFEGLMDCGDSDTETGDGVEGTITRHANEDGSLCVAKLYRSFIDSEDNGLVFETIDPAALQEAVYEAELTFEEQLETPPFELTLEYDPAPPYGDVPPAEGGNDSGFKEAPACAAYPFEVDENGNDVIDENGAKTLVAGAIPEGHEACVISVSHEWDGTTFWHAVFQGDWKFR